jgi:hypothetical protein
VEETVMKNPPIDELETVLARYGLETTGVTA